MTVKGASDKIAAAELADKEQTILELQETNEVQHIFDDIAHLLLIMVHVTTEGLVCQLFTGCIPQPASNPRIKACLLT